MILICIATLSLSLSLSLSLTHTHTHTHTQDSLGGEVPGRDELETEDLDEQDVQDFGLDREAVDILEAVDNGRTVQILSKVSSDFPHGGTCHLCS
jgi:hypothetical protein